MKKVDELTSEQVACKEDKRNIKGKVQSFSTQSHGVHGDKNGIMEAPSAQGVTEYLRVLIANLNCKSYL